MGTNYKEGILGAPKGNSTVLLCMVCMSVIWCVWGAGRSLRNRVKSSAQDTWKKVPPRKKHQHQQFSLSSSYKIFKKLFYFCVWLHYIVTHCYCYCCLLHMLFYHIVTYVANLSYCYICCCFIILLHVLLCQIVT